MKTRGKRNGKRRPLKRPGTGGLAKDPVTATLMGDGAWATQHLDDFVKQHPRKILAVVNRQVAGVGDTADEAIAQARQKFPNALPFLCLVPSKEDLVCVL